MNVLCMYVRDVQLLYTIYVHSYDFRVCISSHMYVGVLSVLSVSFLFSDLANGSYSDRWRAVGALSADGRELG